MTKRKPTIPWTTEADLRCPICGTVHHTILPRRTGDCTIVCVNCHKPFVVGVKITEREDPPTSE